VTKTVVPFWVFLVVAVAIAILAYFVGQWHQGAGIIVALGGSMIWTAYIAKKGVAKRVRHD
jgi:membrane protein YdbS with pleckstrin-like domain